VAALDQERADLNALIREAHEATKDLRVANKGLDDRLEKARLLVEAFELAMQDFDQKVRGVADRVIDNVVDERMTPVVDKFLEQLIEHFEEVKKAVYARFDQVTEELTEGRGKVAWENLPLSDYLNSSIFKSK